MNSKLISCSNKAVYPHVVKAALQFWYRKVAVFCQRNTVRLIWLYYWYKTTTIKYNTAFYFGVYLPCDNDMPKFKRSITFMQSLCTITMINMGKSYFPESLTQVCYLSIIRMLLNLSYCVILLNCAIFVFQC